MTDVQHTDIRYYMGPRRVCPVVVLLMIALCGCRPGVAPGEEPARPEPEVIEAPETVDVDASLRIFSTVRIESASDRMELAEDGPAV